MNNPTASTAPQNSQAKLAPVDAVPAPRTRRSRLDPVRVFVDMNLASRFWFALFVLHALLVHLPRWVVPQNRPEYAVVLDGSGTVIYSRLQRLQEAKALHDLQATLATYAFLNRGPSEFDSPDLLSLMFLSDACAKAKAQFANEEPERVAKQIHQKAEIATIDLLETRKDAFLVHVTGQLIQNGIFQDRSFSVGVPFKLALLMLRNPDLSQNGRLPTAVKDFRYEASR